MILPAAWFVLAAALFATSGLTRPEQAALGDQAIVYSVRSNAPREIALEAALLAFGAIYFVLGVIPGPSYRRVLAWGHFSLFAVGLLLIEAPFVWSRLLSKWPLQSDALREFAVLNLTSTVGYLVMYGGLALFTMTLGEMALRRLKR